MTDTIQKIADEMYARASKLAGEAGDGDHLLQVIGREVAETVNGWADRLRALSPRVTPEMITEQRRALDELEQINARLSARASAGEGGDGQGEHAYNCGVNDAIVHDCSCGLAAAPQPAQAGASGGGDGWWEGLGNEVIDGEACILYQHTTTGAQLWCRKSEHEKVDALLKGLTTPASPATGDAATWEAIDEGGERHYFLREPVGWPNRKPVETPQPAAASEWVMVPRRLTAENGAKSLLSGEFCEHFEFKCAECDDDGMVDGETPCDDCDGRGSHRVKVPVEWTTIKAIHRMVVEHLAAAPQPQADECPACKLGQATCGYHARNPTTPPAHGDGEGEPFGYYIETLPPKAWDSTFTRAPEIAAMHEAAAAGRVKVTPLYTRPTPEAQEARDAARWRALIGSARIRVLGSAGLLTDTRPDGGPWNGYAHIGLELWTKHEAGNEPSDAAEWLTKYADAALALPAQGEGENG